MMDPDPNVNRPLTGEVRLRVPLPIIVPFGALLLIGVLAFGFSRILLSVPKEIATVIAVVTAANIVGACAVLALRKNMGRAGVSELLIVVLYPVIIGAVIATMNLKEAAHGEEHGPAPKPTGDSDIITVTASGTAFDTDELTLAAGQTNKIEFVNEDSVPHNISIYENDDATRPLFEGELVTADTITYEVEAPLAPADAYFRCDVHPAMDGTVTIK